MKGIEITENNTGLNLILALSYGGRQELLMAIRRIADKIQSGEMKTDQVTEEKLTHELYTANVPESGFINKDRR